jgi:tripartite motif-containing protein 71
VLALFAVLLAAVAVPNAMGASTTFSGTVTVGGTAIANFPFSVSSPGTISSTLNWSNASANLSIAIVNPSNVQVALNASAQNPKTVTFNATTTGTYKIRVKAVRGSSSFTADTSYPGVSVPSYAGQVGGGTSGHADMYPSGLTVGPDGTVYVADTGNDQVKAYAPGGTVAWAMGGRGTRAVGSFNNPRDIAYLNGKLYVNDTGNNRVQVIDTTVSPRTVSAWAFRFPSTLGISAGVDAAGADIILVSEDASNQVQVFTPGGTLKCTITGPAGTLSGPRDAATNAAGNVYVADYAHDRIVEFASPNGTSCSQQVVRTWGTHGSGTLQFLRPYGVDVDATGNVFVADSDNNRIQKFSGTGAYLATYGAAVSAGGTFSQLRRVAVANGDVYGADLWAFHVDRFAAPGPTRAQVFGGKPPSNGFFNEPSGLTFDASGNLYVADSVNQRMQRFAPGANGAIWQTPALVWGARGWGASDLSGFNWPRDVTYAGNSGTVWVADTKNNRLLQFTTSGAPVGTSAIGSAASMHWPYAIDDSGNSLIVADTFNNRIQSWSTAGVLNWTQTSANGVAFKNPYDVSVVNGIVYVADAANKRIVKLNAATGAYVSSFGAGNLHSPQGVAVDPLTGSIWVSDTSFNKLAQFTASGTFIQSYGAAGAGNGQFNHPAHLDVHLDASGHAYLYVADVNNDRIQILDLHEN